MIEKIRDFCSEHKLIVIGGLLYIAVYVASNMYSPWIAEELNASAEELPPDFLFFGIYELLTMILYAINKISDSLLSQVMFIVTVSAMFTYVHFIIEKIFDIGFYDEEGLSKKVGGYFLDNILAYIMCLLSYKFFVPAWTNIHKFYSGSGTMYRIIIIALFIVLIILPAILQIGHMATYISLVSLIMKASEMINTHFASHPVLCAVLVFLATVLAIIVMNAILNVILDKFYELLSDTWISILDVLSVIIPKLFIGFVVIIAFAVVSTYFIK